MGVVGVWPCRETQAVLLQDQLLLLLPSEAQAGELWQQAEEKCLGNYFLSEL